MALPPDSVYRGFAAAVSQPVSNESLGELCNIGCLLSRYQPGVMLRNATNDNDVRRPVYRWDTRHYREIFARGFSPRGQHQDQSDAEYYNLERFVNSNRRPLDSSSADAYVFVSTTFIGPENSSQWIPRVTRPMEVYRYEIFAPGGIDVPCSLGERCEYPRQQEIAFAGGIRSQYIRSARAFSFSHYDHDSTFLRKRSSKCIWFNAGFNPNPDDSGQSPQSFLTELRLPRCPALARGEYMKKVTVRRRDKRDTEATEAGVEEEDYEDPLCKVDHYIESAFNSSREDEAYMFFGHQNLLMNYAPGTTDDRIIYGPKMIIESFPSLRETIFATGIDAAFKSGGDEAYIFASDQYALINFAPHSTNDYIIQGPKKITDSFHSLKGTPFADGIDAAFASSQSNEAYIFRGDQYALINFAPGTTDDYVIQGPKKITDSFYSLRGTRFADGIDAAFTSSRTNEAYIFKGEYYALINFAPGTTDDYIIQHKKITESFYSLRGVLPMCLCSHDDVDDVFKPYD